MSLDFLRAKWRMNCVPAIIPMPTSELMEPNSVRAHRPAAGTMVRSGYHRTLDISAVHKYSSHRRDDGHRQQK